MLDKNIKGKLEEAKKRAANYMSLKDALKFESYQYVDFSNPNYGKITSGVTNRPIENKKTAMQQLIDEIVEHLTYDDDLSDDNRTTLETIRLRCLNKLSIEKEQIMEAHRRVSVGLYTDAEKYYNETYGK